MMGRNIGHVANETSACWGLTPKEIINRMTIFPYLSSMLDKNKASDLLGDMIASTSRSGGRYVAGPSWGAAEFRYCKHCILEDRERRVPMHWRRTHQLPGVIICVHHGEFLWSYKNNRIDGRLGFVTPEGSHKLGVSPIASDSMRVRKDAALMYAKISHNLLIGCESIDRGKLRDKFWNFLRLRSRYFYGDKAKECCARLIDICFGEDYLQCARIGLVKHHPWVLSFEKAHISWAVLSESLMRLVERDPDLLNDDYFRTFYDGMPSETIKRAPRMRERPPVECPNLLARHGAGHIVKRTAWRNRALQCACECGMTFTCAELEVGVGPPRITRWGDAYVQEVNRMRGSGYGPAYISRTLGLPLRTVFNMLSS